MSLKLHVACAEKPRGQQGKQERNSLGSKGDLVGNPEPREHTVPILHLLSSISLLCSWWSGD